MEERVPAVSGYPEFYDNNLNIHASHIICLLHNFALIVTNQKYQFIEISKQHNVLCYLYQLVATQFKQ